jgi:outer membrane biosynthesis protein TonB
LEAVAQVAARQESAKLEAARQDSLRLEAERLELARKEAARQAAQQADSARLELERSETARLSAAREAESRREAVLRAIGRQLDEEAARRDAAPPPLSPGAKPSQSSSSARRGRLLGRSDPNAELVQYAEAWARKIQLNMTFDLVREALKRPYTDPLVTVAIRSDGSVESVTFVLSSGVPEIDEAIRRIVQSQVPYQAFSPLLAREFDVVEIRRNWHFDTAVRLY